MMSMVSSPERKRLHPHKFTLWVGMGSIIMMFAGLTSAYIVRRSQSNWLEFGMPHIFWYSTIAIIASSVTIYVALKAFKARLMQRYKIFITITALLGVLFVILQVAGFKELQSHGVQLFGAGSNPAASFVPIIAGLHILHVVGGVIALLFLFFRAYRTRIKSYNSTPIELVSTYWHFVDILWIYLFIFFNWL